jgi:hypothetical protein
LLFGVAVDTVAYYLGAGAVVGLSLAWGSSTLYRENNRREAPDEHGPIYMAIERALWALGPALLLFMLVGHLSTQTARQQADADLAMEIAAENLAFCSNWGIPAGSTEHTNCVLDLTGIRARAEQRVRDEIASQF